MNIQLNLITTSQEEQEQPLANAEKSEIVEIALITVPTNSIGAARIHPQKMKCDFEGCKKRISVIEQLCSSCLCEKNFCTSHKFFMDHGCTFDYQKRERERLIQQLLPNNSKKCFGTSRPEGNNAF